MVCNEAALHNHLSPSLEVVDVLLVQGSHHVQQRIRLPSHSTQGYNKIVVLGTPDISALSDQPFLEIAE